ncbi:MAG: hypothetical protein ACOWYE_09905 [Desulfatiglandales bacterium]
MKTYALFCEIESPFILSSTRGTGHLLSGADHIPGTTLRGALAGLFNKQDFDENKPAWRIFAQDEIHFAPLYPTSKRILSRPVPLSAISCKFEPGFSGDNKDGVLDALVADPPFPPCPMANCRAPTEGFTGYYCYTRGKMSSIRPQQRRVAHTAISQQRQVADSGNLYTYEALDTYAVMLSERKPVLKKQLLGGLLRTKDSGLKDAINKKLEEANWIVRIGKAKSRGAGKLKVEEIREMDDPSRRMPLEQRLEGLNERAKDVFKCPGDLFFSITLETDAILLDPWLRYRKTVDMEDLADVLKVPALKAFTIHRSFSSVHTVSGWNGSIGLPREDELSVRKGSCFLYHAKAQGSFSDEVMQALEQFEQEGIGERKAEGYGRLTVSDPFHWERKGGQQR